MRNTYNRKKPCEPKLLETITGMARKNGKKEYYKVKIDVYDTILDTIDRNQSVGVRQIRRILGEHGYRAEYAMTDCGVRQRISKNGNL